MDAAREGFAARAAKSSVRLQQAMRVRVLSDGQTNEAADLGLGLDARQSLISRLVVVRDEARALMRTGIAAVDGADAGGGTDGRASAGAGGAAQGRHDPGNSPPQLEAAWRPQQRYYLRSSAASRKVFNAVAPDTRGEAERTVRAVQCRAAPGVGSAVLLWPARLPAAASAASAAIGQAAALAAVAC